MGLFRIYYSIITNI